MARMLYPEFLSNQVEYLEAEKLWLREWKELIRSLGEESSWQTPWIRPTFADGSPIQDGNPIFSAVCPERRLAVRVIQCEPHDGDGLGFWSDTFAEGGPEQLSELVISCVLTDEALLKSLDLMRQWVQFGEVQLQHRRRTRLRKRFL